MSRELSNWLDAYLEYTDNSESPLSYHIWCGLATIAGALQRKVYLRWGIGQVIYPNLYVVLIGPSGKTRKGVALGIAKDLLKQVPGVTVAPESSSGKQSTILVMKRAGLDFVDPTDGKTKRHCSVTAFSEELSVFLGQGDIAYLSSLTDWYDSKDDWEYETVGRGKDSIKGVCLNLVGGTAPDWIQSMIPHEAVGGGFTSRVIFIVEEVRRKIVPEHTMTVREIELQEMLVHDLERISKMSGEVRMTAEAKQLYVDWYLEESRKADLGYPAVDDPRFAGYNERRATHLRKLLLVCSAGRGDDLLIIPDDFTRAVSLLTGAELNMHKTFGGFGKSRTSEATETIKNYIEKVGITTRKTVLQRFYRDVDAFSLTQVEETLRQMGLVKVDLIPKSLDKSYVWTGGNNVAGSDERKKVSGDE
jgi:hypothetical protein